MSRLIDTLSAEQLDKVDHVILKHKGRHGSLIPVLKESQDICGYLPSQVQRRIAAGLNLSPSQVFGVVSFYAFFTTVPRGKHIIRVCMGTACYVKGAHDVLEAIKRELQIQVGQTSEDRLFTLQEARCLGACGIAPVIMIDGKIHGELTAKSVVELIHRYRKAARGKTA